MKKSTILIALFFASSFALMSFQKLGKDEKAIKLSDVSASLSMYQGAAGQDFVGESVIYKVIEKDSYDKTFKESALVYATLLQVDETIKGINAGTIPMEGDFATANIGFALQDIPGMKDRIAKLQEQLKNLKPKDDFKGLEMKKAPKAADGIKMANDHLAKSSTMLPSITESLKDVAKKMIKK